MRRFQLLLGITLLPLTILAQDAPDARVTAALLALPEGLRPDATVLLFADDGMLAVGREGSGQMMCLADDPSREDFHVACYHRDLDPFMARGRELRREGKERMEVSDMREAEIAAGSLSIPEHPSALYSISGPEGCYDAATGTLCEDARRLYVVYIPYATAETTGLSTDATHGVPWLMAEGKPWAHIMMMPPE